MTRAEKRRIWRNPPAGWGLLFAPVPGRSGKTRCLICGSTGYGPYGKAADWVDFAGNKINHPAPWQLPHIGGHTVQCVTCRRPFVDSLSISSHRHCKLHHDCCRDHTTVPAWKNPFGKQVAA